MSWAEPGRRVGHKKLPGGGEEGEEGGLLPQKGVGLKERFSAGTDTWWLGVDGKRKGGKKELWI